MYLKQSTLRFALHAICGANGNVISYVFCGVPQVSSIQTTGCLDFKNVVFGYYIYLVYGLLLVCSELELS